MRKLYKTGYIWRRNTQCLLTIIIIIICTRLSWLKLFLASMYNRTSTNSHLNAAVTSRRGTYFLKPINFDLKECSQNTNKMWVSSSSSFFIATHTHYMLTLLHYLHYVHLQYNNMNDIIYKLLFVYLRTTYTTTMRPTYRLLHIHMLYPDTQKRLHHCVTY